MLSRVFLYAFSILQVCTLYLVSRSSKLYEQLTIKCLYLSMLRQLYVFQQSHIIIVPCLIYFCITVNYVSADRSDIHSTNNYCFTLKTAKNSLPCNKSIFLKLVSQFQLHLFLLYCLLLLIFHYCLLSNQDKTEKEFSNTKTKNLYSKQKYNKKYFATKI